MTLFMEQVCRSLLWHQGMAAVTACIQLPNSAVFMYDLSSLTALERSLWFAFELASQRIVSEMPAWPPLAIDARRVHTELNIAKRGS
jgi:hypothetical protein